jgi:hypothetical protein
MRLSTGVSAALARLRDLDPEGREAVRAELHQCAEALDAAARGAMAALLQVLCTRARGCLLRKGSRLRLRASFPRCQGGRPFERLLDADDRPAR